MLTKKLPQRGILKQKYLFLNAKFKLDHCRTTILSSVLGPEHVEVCIVMQILDVKNMNTFTGTLISY